MRAFVVAILFITTSLANAQQADALAGKELQDFLGLVSPQAFRWTKYAMVDFELYNGEARPPLSGHVGFYVGGHPDFKVEPNSAKLKGRVGRYPVMWYRSVAKHGSITQNALIRLDDYWQVDLTIHSKRQEDVDRLISTIGALPVFAKNPKRMPAERPW